MAVAVAEGTVEGGHDAAHERELGPVRPVRELHGHAPDVEDVLGVLGVRFRPDDHAFSRLRGRHPRFADLAFARIDPDRRVKNEEREREREEFVKQS